MNGAALQHQPRNLGQPLLWISLKPGATCFEDHSGQVQAEWLLSSSAQAWDSRAVPSLSLSRSPSSQARCASTAHWPPGKRGSSMRWVGGSQKGGAGTGRTFGELILESDNATEHKTDGPGLPLGDVELVTVRFDSTQDQTSSNEGGNVDQEHLSCSDHISTGHYHLLMLWYDSLQRRGATPRLRVPALGQMVWEVARGLGSWDKQKIR